MNLFYLIAKDHERFRKSHEVRKFRVDRNGLRWRGARVESGGSLRLQGATECQPFRSRCGSPGWFVQGIGGTTDIATRFRADGNVVSERKLTASADAFEPFVLPWPPEPTDKVLDLEIACNGPAPAFIASYFELDRNALNNRCRGKGVELGPGPNPRILPSTDTDVLYVEQKAPDEWATLYGDHYKMDFDTALASYYVVGEAHRIPVEFESLDFIYSSHVFEHLVNPIGHLEIWSGLLRKRGEVVMVIPDYIGSKDFLADASTMESILSEYRSGGFEPSIEHYRRYAEIRGVPGKSEKLYNLKSSIHTHFYTHDNMRDLLEHVVRAGLFEKYAIFHSANAKDFHVIVTK